MSSPFENSFQPSPQPAFTLFCGLLCVFALASGIAALSDWAWGGARWATPVLYAMFSMLTLVCWSAVSSWILGRKQVFLLTTALVALHFVTFGLPRLWWEAPPLQLGESLLAGQVLYHFGSATIGFFLACITVLSSRREVLLVSVLPTVLLVAGAWWVLRHTIDAGQVVTSIGMGIGLIAAGLGCFELVQNAHVRRLFGNRKDDRLLSELQNAKRVHEAMFPDPIADENLRFGYAYRPMRQIGGDFIHINRADSGAFYLTVVDVTGHGITSALTVNRLHAELKQYFATADVSCPSEALGHLNDYVRLTMAEHSLFATGMCVRLDPTDSRLTVANAGHPLCYVRDREGLREVDAAGPMLGVFEREAFDCTPVSFNFSAGDQLVMVTDGAIESRSPADEPIGTERLRNIIERSCRQTAPSEQVGGAPGLLQRRMSGRLLDRADVRKPVGLIQQVLRQGMNAHPCALADEIMLSIDDFVQQDSQDDILIATIELLQPQRNQREPMRAAAVKDQQTKAEVPQEVQV